MWRPRLFADSYVAIVAMTWAGGLYDLAAKGRPVMLVGAAFVTAAYCWAKTATVVSLTPNRVVTYSLFARRRVFTPADVELTIAYGGFAGIARLYARDDGRMLAHLGGMLSARPVERLRRRASDAGVTVSAGRWGNRARVDLAGRLLTAVALAYIIVV